MPTLNIEQLGQIQRANLEFGDLTVFVGPQATGKSIALQLLKLMVDAGQVIGMLPALLRGKLWGTQPGLLNAAGRELRISTDEGYILDGEVYPSGVPRDLVIRVGPKLRFLRP